LTALFFVFADAGGNDGNTTREIALIPDTTTVNNPVHGGDGEMQQMDVAEEEAAAGGSSSQGRSYVRLTREQTEALEEAFQENQNPDTVSFLMTR
jgi:hypothetical protein